MRITFISWARYQRRSEALAAHLEARMRFIHHGRTGHRWSAAWRYFRQARETWRALREDRPEVVIVQNPPLPLVALAYLYGRLYRASYIIDSHTGAFLSPPWSRFLWLHAILSRRALITLIHNAAQARFTSAWGCRWMELNECPLAMPPGEPAVIEGRFRVLVPSSFADDEPIGEVIGAARLLPDVEFYITGDPTRMPSIDPASLPPNCHCTGYLPYERYLGLMRGVDVVVALTTREGTLLQGASEAVALGQPLILSGSVALRTYFCQGALHTENTAVGIAEAVRKAERDLPALRLGIRALGERMISVWQEQIGELEHLINVRCASGE